MNTSSARASGHGPLLPWWRVGMVWLALAGPAVVVVAGVATAVVAFEGADPTVRPAAGVAQAPAVARR
jgi:hypothetical protein